MGPYAMRTRLSTLYDGICQNCLSTLLYQVQYSTLVPIVVQIWVVGGFLALFSCHFILFVVIVVQFLHTFLKFPHLSGCNSQPGQVIT